MPIREYYCAECKSSFENLELKESDKPSSCKECGSASIERKITTYGGYTGNFGGGSTRNRQHGSFKKRI